MGKQESKAWYLLRENGKGWKVSKVENDRFVSSYRVNDAECTCPAGVHDRHCKHLDMVNQLKMQDRGRKVTVATARQVAVRVIRGIQDHFASISMDGMERQEGCEQMVVLLRLKAQGIKSEDLQVPFTMFALVDGVRVQINAVK